MKKVFPTVLIVQNLISAVPYALEGDAKMTVYWVSAAVLNFSLTWM